jgi:hypothetical protein
VFAACSPFAQGNVSPETATSHRGGLRDGTTLSDDRLRDDGPSDEGLRNGGLVLSAQTEARERRNARPRPWRKPKPSPLLCFP